MSAPVTAIVVVWNGWTMARRCLECLRSVEYDPLQVIVVDNGSDHPMPSYFRALPEGIDLLRSDQNLGFGGGNNIGIRAAIDRGAEFVWLVNSDAFPAPASLATMVRLAQDNADVGAVGSVVRHEDGRLQAWGGGSLSRWNGRTIDALAPDARVDYLTGASMLLRSHALCEVGLFDQRYFMYWEDVDLCLRLRKAGWRIAVAAEAEVIHLCGGSSDPFGPRVAGWAAAGLVRTARKHLPMPWIPATLGFLPRWLGLVRRGRWESARSAWRGWRDAWKEPL